jgi:uncharacterized protein YbjT (DUF2867 family)
LNADEAVAIVVGATGLVGTHCVDRLIHTPSYERLASLVRQPPSRREERVVGFEHDE